MTRFSTPFHFIRVQVFGIQTQEEFARLLDYTQANVSRIETGERRLNSECQERIRALAKKRGIAWNNNWFFTIPEETAPPGGVSPPEELSPAD